MQGKSMRWIVAKLGMAKSSAEDLDSLLPTIKVLRDLITARSRKSKLVMSCCGAVSWMYGGKVSLS